MSCTTSIESLSLMSQCLICSFVWLSEGTHEAQTGGTPPSGHQGKPLTLISILCVRVKWIKGCNSIHRNFCAIPS